MKQIFENSTDHGFSCKYPSIPILCVTEEEWEANKDEYSKVIALYCPQGSGSSWFMGEEFPLDQHGASYRLDRAIALALSRR